MATYADPLQNNHRAQGSNCPTGLTDRTVSGSRKSASTTDATKPCTDPRRGHQVSCQSVVDDDDDYVVVVAAADGQTVAPDGHYNRRDMDHRSSQTFRGSGFHN